MTLSPSSSDALILLGAESKRWYQVDFDGEGSDDNDKLIHYKGRVPVLKKAVLNGYSEGWFLEGAPALQQVKFTHPCYDMIPAPPVLSAHPPRANRGMHV
jgi:hypothetical protein